MLRRCIYTSLISLGVAISCCGHVQHFAEQDLNGVMPLQHASYVLALHQSGHVKMIGFSEEGPARAVYNTVSNGWAKIIMDRRRSQDLLSHDGARWIKKCKEEVVRLSLFEEHISLSPAGLTLSRVTRVTVLE
ncbi:hypothetical protein ARMSODRAFT_725283 [Armillaria solidipes]|uniref:Uncharacterized protein n=1 Tax=Armillaria solidipes TaxID=1076256 RepID=A0A2H3AUZ0_9AGAR|nr:hypothetical protein ARMSODRAFT_725283 [Armillaria solidipes]